MMWVMNSQVIIFFVGGGVVFFVIIWLVLFKVIPQKLGKANAYALLASIVLFAFIIAILGMCLFGIFRLSDSMTALSIQLADAKANNLKLTSEQAILSQKNAKLLAEVSKIQELELKGDSASVEILAAEIILDLRGWKQVAEQNLDKMKESLVILKTRRRLWKAKSEVTKFPATYGTSSKINSEFSSSHLYEVKENLEPIPPNKEVLRRWMLWYDISSQNKFEPFDVESEIKEWNSMQNSKQEHRGTIILFSTRSLSYKIIFPATKLPVRENTRCYYYGLDHTSKKPFDNPKLNWSADGSSVEWILDEPRLLYHYEIWWDW